jgi:hypothetical protein
MEGDVEEAAVRSYQRRYDVRMCVVVLDRERSFGAQHLSHPTDQRPDQVQAVDPAEDRVRRIMVGHLGR